MIRRKFLEYSTKSLIALGFNLPSVSIAEAMGLGPQQNPASSMPPQKVLPDTAPLTQQGDLAIQMEEGIKQFLLGRTREVPKERALLWRWDYSSKENYEKSVAAHRENLRKIVGAMDARAATHAPDLLAAAGGPAEIARGTNYTVKAVRWPVFDPVEQGTSGMYAEGLLLEPTGPEVARVVAIPDADWTPEMLAGLSEGVPATAQFARRLAENGCLVLIPLLINRDDKYSGVPGVVMTNEPHREIIYRLAFEVGRHIIGYEVQKVLAAVDWFASRAPQTRIGVMGYGEGALIAFYAAALDPRIDATVVSGYFQEREDVWKEPLYRDIWGLLLEFGDAEIASLIAPRKLIVEACAGPEVDGPPRAIEPRRNMACVSGKLTTPPIDSVLRETDRARVIYAALSAEKNLELVVNDGGHGLPGSQQTLESLLHALGVRAGLRPSGDLPRTVRPGIDPQLQLHSQLEDMMTFSQGLAKNSADRRAEFWSKADTSSVERWLESSKPMRDYVWTEVFGRLPEPTLPLNPRTRLVYDQPRFAGYEVVTDVWPGIFNYGILLVPKDIRPDERRPVVICQHGLESTCQEVADPGFESPEYHQFAVSLANLGFVTYSPQAPFLGAEHFRINQRIAHPLKVAIYSVILGQHQQMFKWLDQLPYVDPKRIAFYGHSYGGKMSIRVPPLLDRYTLNICSGDFADLTSSMTGVHKNDFVFDDSWDLYEFDAVNVINYAELAKMMLPRIFMVSRGRMDDASLEQVVAMEYVLVKDFYNQFGMADRTEIVYFDGPHEINGSDTFPFLRKHLYPESLSGAS